MPFIRNKGNIIGICFFSLSILSVFVGGFWGFKSADDTGAGVKVASILTNHAWEEALRTDISNRKPFAINRKIASEPKTDASVLEGISGETQVHSDEIPIASYKGAVVPAGASGSRNLLKNVSVGDIIRIINVQGKPVYYQVVRRPHSGSHKICGDLETSQKDTRLADCELMKKSKEIKFGNYALRKLPVPEIENLLKKDLKADHQS